MGADKIERIRAAYARDMKERPKAVRYGDIPIDYDAITPEWLTAILCRGIAGGAVTGLRLGEVDTGTSNRRRIFVDYNVAGRDAGLPPSIFCKATHDLVNRILLSSTGTFSEVSFYNRVRPLLEIDTPEAYFADYDPDSWASIIVLRDIGNEVEFCTHETRMDRASVESQLDLLARMHGRFLAGSELKGPLSDLFTFRERFAGLTQRHGLRDCCNRGFDAAEAVIPARLFARAGEVWDATLRSVERQAELPETFTHNDVHLKNWFIRTRPAMGLSDWQSSGRGSWARDIAYCISTALEPADRRAWERDLIRFYLDRLAASGAPTPDFDEAFRNYREQLLSVLAWWTMTLTPSADMPDMQPEDTTLAFIGRIATAMDDLETLDVDA
jgi:hypothetical protein